MEGKSFTVLDIIQNFKYLFKLKQFIQAHVYSWNCLLKLNQALKLAKSDNIDEWKNYLGETHYKKNIIRKKQSWKFVIIYIKSLNKSENCIFLECDCKYYYCWKRNVTIFII